MFPPANSDESDGRREVGRAAWELSYKERGAEGSTKPYRDIGQYLLTILHWCWSISSDNMMSIFSDCHTVINFLLSIFVCTHDLDGHCPDDDADERGRDRADFQRDRQIMIISRLTIIMTSHQINNQMSEDEIERIFKEIDKDESGSITKKEAVRACRRFLTFIISSQYLHNIFIISSYYLHNISIISS